MISRTARYVLLGLAAVLFAAPAFTKDLWTPDEPRYALVAQEMVRAGDWVVLHRNGEVYREKPPLFFWSIAALSIPFDAVNEITARAPSILAALLTLSLTYDLARRMFGERAGVWSALVLATTFRFWWQSNTGQIDMLLTACTTLSIYALWRFHEDRGARWAAAYHAGAALGLLAKGPPALLFTVFSAVGFLWGRRSDRRGLWLWLGIPVSIVPVALWFYAARRAGMGEAHVDDEIAGTFARQIVGRIFEGVSHAQPPWHYLINLPIEWFPWVMFLPWTMLYSWRLRREGPAMRLLLSWFVPALIFFHLIVEKRAVYLLPLYPPLAILMARSVLALIDEGRRGWLRATAILWLFVALGAAFSPFFAGFVSLTEHVRPIVYVLTVAGLSCVAWTAALIRAQAWRHWPVALVAQTAALLLAIGMGAFPIVNDHKSAREFCAPVRALADTGDVRVFSVRLMREEYIFYSNTRHRVLLRFPGASAFGDPDDPAAQERAYRAGPVLRHAGRSVPLRDPPRPTAEERAALRGALDSALAGLGLTDAEMQRYLAAIARDVQAALDEVRGETPAVLFCTADDWRWMLAFAGDTSFLTMLKDRRVSSREVLLLANPAAVEALGKTSGGGPD